MAKRLLRKFQFNLSHDLPGPLVVQFNDRSTCGHQSMAGGIQHDQAAWFAGRHEPGTIFTAMDGTKYQSTTENPNSLTGPEILGLPTAAI